MDFGKLLQGPDADAPTEPRELYEALPEKAEGYGYLRDVQGQVLSAWHERRDERDLVVKVNTGGGKTIDGLVILQSLLNEGFGPALYVAPGKQLVKQVIAEAGRLGIRTVDDPETSEYLAGDAIAVVNSTKLVNGQSIFSAKRPSRPPVPIGSVIIDDAHAALATVRENLSIKLKSSHNAYQSLLALFRGDLRQSAPTALLDIDEQSYGALAPVPFWAWQNKAEQVRVELHKCRESSEIKWVWPAISDVLPLCRAVFTGTELAITPPCPPIRHVTEFADAKRRIYLTATLADDSILVETFGANPVTIRRPIAPQTAGDIGERMILAPQGINPNIIVDDARAAIAELAKHYNVVVLVPSNKAAGDWRPHGAKVVSEGSEQVEALVNDLRTAHVGLVVLANRYDGIDLPGTACRVLVLDGLPEAKSPDERHEAMLLRHAGTDDRQVQRVEQGMGRGVRSNEDHCVVFLLGTRLSQLVVDPRSLARFSPATRAQLKLSKTVADAIPGKQLEDVMKAANQALNRDQSWILIAKRGLAAVKPEPGTVSSVSIARRAAFEAAVNGSYKVAADITETVEADIEDARTRGWLREQRAAYEHHVNPEEAQRLLVSAKHLNDQVLRPLSGIEFRKLEAQSDQARRATDFLSSAYVRPEQLRLAFQAIVDDLIFDPDQAIVEAHEEALYQLGPHLGYPSQRPEKMLGEGPDVLWALSATHYWVIESKSGVKPDAQIIYRRDANQLAGSMNWFPKRYGEIATATPVMVHRAHHLNSDASATTGMMILNENGIQRLKAAVLKYAAGLASTRWDDTAAVGSLLRGNYLEADDLREYLRSHVPAK